MNKISLNNNWKYLPTFKEEYIKDFPVDYKDIRIPHTNKELPYNNFSEKEYQFISSYEQVLKINKEENKRYILKFEGVMIYSEVFVNQTKVGSHKGGYTPFQFDITEYVVDGDNKIFVKVDSTERKDIPPHGFVVDYLTYGGIYREVYLEIKERSFIDQAFFHTEGHHFISRVFIDSDEDRLGKLEIVIKKDKEELYTLEGDIPLSEEDMEIQAHIHFEPWSLDNPELYDIEVYLDGVLNLETKFGDRTIEMTPEGLFLNGEHIKLIGLNRHQAYPYVGYAMPSNAQKKDADILKYELGVNVVRSSHYPPSKHFLDRCDEIGLLVFNEIPGWQHIGDKQWQEVAIENTYEMVYRDYNHPSIFIWGTRINESPDNDDFYKKTYEVARSLDKIRPIGGVRNFKGSNLIEDVYTYNDFVHRGNNVGLEKVKEVAKKQVPYLVTEYNGHMFPTKKYDDEAHRIEHAKRHLNVQHANFSDPSISGAIGWCMFDYNTHKDFGSGDRICYHGVMDMFRIPKYAASVYRSQNEDPYLEVLSNLNVGEKEASEIKELLVMTNADFVKFYINKDFIGDFYPSKEYGALPHPPVVIDDFIGNLIHDNEDFSKKDADFMKEALLSIMRNGLNLPLSLKVKLGLFLKKHKMTIDQAAKFYEKYVGKWGQESITYRFEAMKNNEVVASKVVGSTDGSKLVISVDDSVLDETDTYQVTRVIVEHVNENNNPLTYSTEVISIDINGPLELIGPNILPLTGGSTGFYVKTINKKGISHIKVKGTTHKEQKVVIEVQ